VSARELITEHLDLWTGAVTKKSSSGRGSNGKVELTGVKKLRELILELAVRGSLVHQDQNEEPAALLAEKIATEKAALMQAGAIKKSPKLPQISPDEIPFDIPNGWHWIRLGELVKKIGSGATPRGGKNAYVQSGIPFLRSQNIWNNGLSLQDVAYIPPEIHERMANTHVFPNDILLNITGASLGRCAVVPADLEAANVSQHVTIIRTIDPLNRWYLHYLILSPYVQSLVWGRQVGMAREGLSKKVLEQFEIPLPPLEEQHRIVQKVDELMALCDRLEQQTSDQLEAHETLVDTLLGTLTQSKNANELADNWARLAAHFDTLFTTEQSIDKLKQTILQLAVMGRLVEQDAGGEPAEDMLGQLAELKQELIAQGLLKKERKSQPVDSEDAPYEIPESWSWCSLTDIGELARGKSKHRPRNDPSLYQDGTVPLIQTGDVARASPWITTFSAKYNQRGVEQSRLWRPGTLCITIAANIGDTGLLSFDACFPDSVVGFTPFWSDIPPEYFEYFLRTAKQHLEDFAPSTAQKNINLEVLQKLLVPLPPVSEMTRIVQKVDELMTLCDQLKERLNQASETRNQLAESVVEGALSS